MKFIGREEELARLEKEYERDGGFVVLYGRRRVGKTTLVKKFIENRSGYYFLATDEPESMAMDRFSQMLSRTTGNSIFRNAHFQDWLDIFRAFSDIRDDEKKILVIDEFPYLVRNNPSFPSILQNAWDEILKDRNVMLILSGSLLSMMKKHALDADSPLYGRRTAQICLEPLAFTELLMTEDRDFDDALLRYAITGGVPKYVELLSSHKSFYDILENEVIDRNGFFYEEPYLMFRDEVSSPVTYFGILKSIALGNHRAGDIASSFNFSTTEISPYLRTLRSLDAVERIVPITERNPEKSRKGLYYIKDNFLRFWFRYIFPFYGEIGLGFHDDARDYIARDFQSGFLSYVFEEVSKDIFRSLCRERKIDFTPSLIGKYWSNTKTEDIEIDIASEDRKHRVLFLGECKCHERPVGLRVLRELEEKDAGSSELRSSFPGWKRLYGIFSRSGFDDALIEEAEGRKDVILINRNERIR